MAVTARLGAVVACVVLVAVAVAPRPAAGTQRPPACGPRRRPAASPARRPRARAWPRRTFVVADGTELPGTLLPLENPTAFWKETAWARACWTAGARWGAICRQSSRED